MDEMIQDVPETCSDERMHVLDETCWCKPYVDVASDGLGACLRHRKAA